MPRDNGGLTFADYLPDPINELDNRNMFYDKKFIN